MPLIQPVASFGDLREQASYPRPLHRGITMYRIPAGLIATSALRPDAARMPRGRPVQSCSTWPACAPCQNRVKPTSGWSFRTVATVHDRRTGVELRIVIGGGLGILPLLGMGWTSPADHALDIARQRVVLTRAVLVAASLHSVLPVGLGLCRAAEPQQRAYPVGKFWLPAQRWCATGRAARPVRLGIRGGIR